MTILKCNEDKTELLLLGSPRHFAKVSVQNIQIGGVDIVPTASVRNLGAIFDSKMSMEKQVGAVCVTSSAT